MGGKPKDRHFEDFRPHTRFKHLVLRHYIEAWTRKLLLRAGAGDEVLLVDAFAGVGMDEQGRHGSPIILARIAADAESQLRQQHHGRECHIRLVAIEKDARKYAQLKANLEPFGERAHVRHGTLAHYLPELLAREPAVPTIAFLDPCGVDGLDASLVRQILALPRNEVLARFSDEGALRHFGVVSAERLHGSAEAEDDLPLFAHTGGPAITKDAQAKAERRKVSREVTAARARAILCNAFGGDYWEAVISGVPSGPGRRRRFVALYRDLLAETGARYTTAVPVWDDGQQLDATLIHASRSPYGRSTLKEAVERAIKQCELPPQAKALIQLDLRTDLDEVVRSTGAQFAGQTIAWVDKEAGVPSVRRFVLQETEVFVHQLRDLKRKLKDAGLFASRGKEPILLRFPPN